MERRTEKRVLWRIHCTNAPMWQVGNPNPVTCVLQNHPEKNGIRYGRRRETSVRSPDRNKANRTGSRTSRHYGFRSLNCIRVQRRPAWLCRCPVRQGCSSTSPAAGQGARFNPGVSPACGEGKCMCQACAKANARARCNRSSIPPRKVQPKAV